MLNNEVYKKIKRIYSYNKFLDSIFNNVYILWSLCIPLTIMFFINIHYVFKNVLIPYNFSSSIFIYILSFFTALYFIFKLLHIGKYTINFLTTKTILNDKEQEENIIYAVNNMPEEENLLNDIFIYIEEMIKLHNQVDLNKNNHYKKLENKIKNQKFKLKKHIMIKN